MKKRINRRNGKESLAGNREKDNPVIMMPSPTTSCSKKSQFKKNQYK